ncbi:MAG: SDR family NAD(P)-dependent oxidoreductase [Propionibacteriaceae bacterium]|nr:SDR family NAD(P)-dependent oxidoreductase [Propionibacteriaceae bacterium]
MVGADKTLTVAMTGVTAGLGRATVPLLARRGVRLVLLARNLDKAKAVAADARKAGSPQVEVVECDLSLMASVRQAVVELAARNVGVDVIVNDAAMVTSTRQVTVEGNELMLATNYLGPCLLSRLILDGLPEGSPVRLVSVGGPLEAKPDLTDLDCAESFSLKVAFERSKTALNLFTAAVPSHVGAAVQSAIYSPGLMRTGLSATIAGAMNRLAGGLAGHVLPEPAGLADGLARLVLDTDLDGARPGTLFNSHGKASPMPLADDVGLQEALWKATSARLGLE